MAPKCTFLNEIPQLGTFQTIELTFRVHCLSGSTCAFQALDMHLLFLKVQDFKEAMGWGEAMASPPALWLNEREQHRSWVRKDWYTLFGPVALGTILGLSLGRSRNFPLFYTLEAQLVTASQGQTGTGVEGRQTEFMC